MPVAELKIALKTRERELHEKFHLKSLSVFGSVARGESKEESDIDLVVEFDQAVGDGRFFETKAFLRRSATHRSRPDYGRSTLKNKDLLNQKSAIERC